MFSPGEQFLTLPQADLQKLNHPLLNKYAVEVDVLRLDKIHPVVSGNKFFKLRYFIAEAERRKTGVLTFGGAWSNHLLATAFSCQQCGIHATGIIRGERPPVLSATLHECERLGMHLEFVSRSAYSSGYIPPSIDQDLVIIPEGGASALGVKGASTILDYFNVADYDEIACSVGTGTMMAGLLQQRQAMVRGFSSLKIASPLNNNLHSFLLEHGLSNHFKIEYGFHFGGYAKHPADLTAFMNSFHEQTSIPTDIVYTGKLFYGILSLVGSGTIAPGRRICVIHSGGLQGNRSLPPGRLQY